MFSRMQGHNIRDHFTASIQGDQIISKSSKTSINQCNSSSVLGRVHSKVTNGHKAESEQIGDTIGEGSLKLLLLQDRKDLGAQLQFNEESRVIGLLQVKVDHLGAQLDGDDLLVGTHCEWLLRLLGGGGNEREIESFAKILGGSEGLGDPGLASGLGDSLNLTGARMVGGGERALVLQSGVRSEQGSGLDAAGGGHQQRATALLQQTKACGVMDGRSEALGERAHGSGMLGGGPLSGHDAVTERRLTGEESGERSKGVGVCRGGHQRAVDGVWSTERECRGAVGTVHVVKDGQDMSARRRVQQQRRI
mmetsp:Transcript_23877/g.59724  ORF Transcript_23877/g.59724 Transcript_23877/m.59724 type:complete len:307 (+) Transcript_23877:707-1627(+)